MSLSGQLLRGLKWHNFRNVDGVYDPNIKSDPHKMGELQLYLDFVKDRDTKQVHKILEKIMLCDLMNKPKAKSEEEKKLLELKEVKKGKKDVK